MRIRLAVLGAVLVAATAACSDDPDPDARPSGPMTEITVDCEEFADAAKAITDAQTALYASGPDGDTDGDDAIDALVAELDGLKDDAPDDVRAALTSLGAGFRIAEAILADPTPEKQAELAELAPRLAEDGQKVTAYITSECG